MSAADATVTDPEPTTPDADEERAEPYQEDPTEDYPMPGGLRGLV